MHAINCSHAMQTQFRICVNGHVSKPRDCKLLQNEGDIDGKIDELLVQTYPVKVEVPSASRQGPPGQHSGEDHLKRQESILDSRLWWMHTPTCTLHEHAQGWWAIIVQHDKMIHDDTIAFEDLLHIFFLWIMQRECFAPNALISQSLAHAVANTHACSQNDMVLAKCYRDCPRQSTRRSGCSNMHATATHSSCMRHSEQCMQHDESINTLGQSKGT